MRIGIAGAGSMGRTHAASWRALGATISGVLATPDPTGDALSAAHGAPIVDTIEELAAHADIVDICLPTFLHADAIVAAVPAKKPIFCEKPLARTVADAERAVAACEEAGVPLGVGHVIRFFPAYEDALRRVAAGETGPLAVLRLNRGGFRPGSPWFADDAKSGGVILDLMIHDIDFALRLAGPVASVFARLDDPARTATEGGDLSGTGQFAHAILTHRCSAITHIESSWRYPPPHFRTSFEIAGRDGLIAHDSASSAPIVPFLAPARDGSKKPAPNVPVAAEVDVDDPYTRELRAFAEAVASGRPVPVPGAYGVETVRIAAALERSVQTGRAVVFPSDTPSDSPDGSHGSTDAGSGSPSNGTEREGSR